MERSMLPWLWVCVACGGTAHTNSERDASTDDASSADAGDANATSLDSGAPTGSLVADCPSTVPTEGTACTHRGVECEYGDDWSARCNTLATCWSGGAGDGTWQIQAPSTGDSCPTPTTSVAGCLAEQPSGSCSASDPTGLCIYADARCTCYASVWGGAGGGTTYEWKCTTAPAEGCPATRPRVGSACTGSLWCTYQVCEYGGGASCDDGVWSAAVIADLCGGG